MKLKIKKLSKNSVLPTYAKQGDAGLDLTAITKSECIDNIITYGTGLSIAIPEGYVGLLFPRSSIYKQDMYLTNCVGVIDSGYRGEIMFKFAITESEQYANVYNVGDRIGQLILFPYPQLVIEEVEKLTETGRGNNGFGSTGK